MKKPTITKGADGILAIEPEGPITCALPSYIVHIQTRLAHLEQLTEAREFNAALLTRETRELNVLLLAVNPDDTDAMHKLAFGEQRVALLERRALLLNDAFEGAIVELFNANCRAQDRMKAAALKHDSHRHSREIEETLAANPKLERHDLERKAKTWPALTRDKAQGIGWDHQKKPEATAKRILDLAEEIFTDLPELAKA